MRFAEVIGQSIIKERMRHGVQIGRIPHAQLILGAEGSGNLALAMAYVQYILCDHRSETDSCGECS
ncbi:MAG: DNA polymerase III subunit delta, partial [Bacteroidota bacterium]